jgi:hypothetical protein
LVPAALCSGRYVADPSFVRAQIARRAGLVFGHARDGLAGFPLYLLSCSIAA